MDSTDSWLSPARLTRLGSVVLLGLVAAVAIVTLTADGTTTIASGRLGGDFAPFRTAGVLAQRDPMLLLDVDAQQAEMARYLDGDFAPFPYPPLFAFLYVPFAFLSFEMGYVFYVFLLAIAGVIAVVWTMDLLDVSSAWRPVGLLGGLTYAGTFASWGGAQNATITMLLLAGAFRFLDRGNPTAAGAVLALLWFKPQFAVPVLLLMLVARHLRTVAVAVAGGVALWLGNAVVFGRGWSSAWLDVLAVTDAGNRVFNTGNTVSVVEWLRGVLDAPWGDVGGLAVAAALGIGCAAVAVRRREPVDLLVLSSLALLVTAPHALRYELTLLVPAMGVLARSRGAAFAVAVWAVSPILILDVPALVRVAYVWGLAALWLRDVLGDDMVDASREPGQDMYRPTRAPTIAQGDVERMAPGVPS